MIKGGEIATLRHRVVGRLKCKSKGGNVRRSEIIVWEINKEINNLKDNESFGNMWLM